jgi:hypothetical protein
MLASSQSNASQGEESVRPGEGPSRRGFLGALLGAIAGAALDPERALWIPGSKKIFLPPVLAPLTREQIASSIAQITAQQQFIINSFRGLIYAENVINVRANPIYDTKTYYPGTLIPLRGGASPKPLLVGRSRRRLFFHPTEAKTGC